MLELAEREQLWVANGVQDLGGESLALSSTSALSKMVERQPFVGSTLLIRFMINYPLTIPVEL